MDEPILWHGHGWPVGLSAKVYALLLVFVGVGIFAWQGDGAIATIAMWTASIFVAFLALSTLFTWLGLASYAFCVTDRRALAMHNTFWRKVPKISEVQIRGSKVYFDKALLVVSPNSRFHKNGVTIIASRSVQDAIARHIAEVNGAT